MAKLLRYCVMTVLLTQLFMPLPRAARATEPALMRIATLAPAGTGAGRVFHGYDKTLQQRTAGRLRARLYAGGVAGDERDVIRKMKVGQLEAAALTATGLGQIVRSVLVLQMPGLFESREQLAKVRGELAQSFLKQFLDAGYVLLGWGDVGDRRLFSSRPLASPSDFKAMRPWVWRDDPLGTELMSLIGASGIPLGLPEVFPALQTGMVDTVTATATTAVGLQWFRFVKYMSMSTGEPVIGAFIVRKPWFDAQPSDVQKHLLEASTQLEQQLLAGVHAQDERAAVTLRARGIKEFDMMARRAEWEPVLTALAERMTGRLFTRELLERVYKSARGVALPSSQNGK